MKTGLVIIAFTLLSLTLTTEVNIEALDSSNTPKALGPYSKATRIDMGNLYMIYSSGSIGLDPKTGELVSEDVAEQTRQTLDNLKNLLE
jgi:2-iminobutanoate/2-iminopropanoate deaminase